MVKSKRYIGVYYNELSNKDKSFYLTYIVLGVSANDDFSDIKKAYKKLVRIYHPDLNPDDIQRMTEITQQINKTYEKLEKYHK